MPKLKLTPTNQLTLFLVIFAGLATYFNFPNAQSALLWHLLETVGLGLLLYAVFSRFATTRHQFQNTLITTLIIYLVLHYPLGTTDHYITIIATTVAMLAKFFFGPASRFATGLNPAVFGLLVSAVGFRVLTEINSAFLSWWGTNFQGALSLALLLLWTLVGLAKWRKLAIVGAFLLSHYLILAFTGTAPETLNFIFTDGTIYFLAAIMLVEPRTSPLLTWQQVTYGLAAALFLNLFYAFELPYTEVLSIAAANLYFQAIKKRPKPKPQPPQPTPPTNDQA